MTKHLSMRPMCRFLTHLSSWQFPSALQPYFPSHLVTLPYHPEPISTSPCTRCNILPSPASCGFFFLISRVESNPTVPVVSNPLTHWMHASSLHSEFWILYHCYKDDGQLSKIYWTLSKIDESICPPIAKWEADLLVSLDQSFWSQICLKDFKLIRNNMK